MIVKSKELSWLVAVPLFAIMLVVYVNALPASFNTRYENHAFFDSHGEFITRQIREGRTYHHNDHLLYHVLAKAVVQVAPAGHRRPARYRRWSFGPKHFLRGLGHSNALPWGRVARRKSEGGVGLCPPCRRNGRILVLLRYDRHVYSPSALLLALKCLRDQRLIDYGWLGLAISVAFLFRTDAVLLATLGLVAFADVPTPSRAGVYAPLSLP